MLASERNNPILWVSAAEASGDMHGAKLIDYLSQQAPSIEYRGMGGSEMRKTVFQAEINAEQLSVMGFTEVFEFLPHILKLFKKIKQRLKILKPSAVILIDSPDFHFHIAKMANKLEIPVYYYISPQVWAWRKGRVRFLRKYVHKMLCIVPFEEPFFQKHGVKASFVGHPLQDDLQEFKSRAVEKKTLALLPGSREKEVKSLMPYFAHAASILASYDPQISFKLIKASQIPEKTILDLWPQQLPLKIFPSSERYTQISTCQFAIAASGTVTLEASLLGVPTIVTYKLSSVSHLLGRLLIKVSFISMPNLILNGKVLPEYIQNEVTGTNLANQIIYWLQNPAELDKIRHNLTRLEDKLGPPGATQRAGDIILNGLNL